MKYAALRIDIAAADRGLGIDTVVPYLCWVPHGATDFWRPV